MAKINFTASRVNDYGCEAGKQQSILLDADARGLGLRATANGSKSYVFQFKRNGKSGRMTIGSLDTWTIPKVREEARKLQRLIDQGQDPREVKAGELAKHDAQSSKDAGRATLARAVWDAYLKAPHPQWGDR
jgi:hypothetical protein